MALGTFLGEFWMECFWEYLADVFAKLLGACWGMSGFAAFKFLFGASAPLSFYIIHIAGTA